MAKTKQAKNRIRDWKGLLSGYSRKERALVFLVLFVASASIIFMQFGFIGIGANGRYSTHVLGLLAPIAISALLLGKGWATLEGALCGVVLFLHAMVQPLDLYERYFVGPCNSIVMYTIVGFLLGLLFAVALRNNPRGVRRILYIGIVSVVIAAYASTAFGFSAIADMIIILASHLRPENEVPRDVLTAAAGMGDIALQACCDALLLFVFSLALDFGTHKYLEQRAYESVLTTFRVRLLIVVVLVFLVVQGGAFAYITVQEEQTAKSDMAAEIEFIAKQVEAKDRYIDALMDTPEFETLSVEALTTLVQESSLDTLIEGYSLESDGTVVLFTEDVVLHSDSPAYPKEATMDELFGKGSDLAKNLGKDDNMCQIVYSTHEPADIKEMLDESYDSKAFADIELGYMCAKKKGHDYTIMMSKPASMVFVERQTTMRWATTLAFVLVVVVYWLAARLLRRVMVEPLVRANDSLQKITAGDLEERVSETDSVELTMLSSGINRTVASLEDLINEAERRNERDLATAKTIQESALPSTFPPFPEIDKFDIFASMNAAKEVGGDFYDFFLIDDRTLGFLIADVSGKGIPGALFMMAAKTEIENYMSTGMAPAEAIASANRRLCANNDAGMFVTVWAATLVWETGELTYVNAGHNFPLLRHGQGGEWEWLTKKCGLFLGTFETAKYRQETLTLEPGDELLLYTDGVNEAFNVDEEEYGNDRLEAFLAAHNDLHARNMVRSLRADVAAWAEDAEQSDDVTILALEYGAAPEVTNSITVPATLDHLEEAESLIRAELEQRLCPVSVISKVEVALEELFVNVCRYAYADQKEPGQVQVSYTYGANPSAITIELRDQGIPFDPIKKEDPTKPSNAQEAKIGGLGIFMVKKSMDDFFYMRDRDSNVVVFKKGW